MTDYLAELGAAFPEVKSLDAYRDAVRAARSLERSASVDAALSLAAAFGRWAPLRDQPDARLSPESLAGTASAKALKAEAEQVFGNMPDQLGALSAVSPPAPTTPGSPPRSPAMTAPRSRTRSTRSSPTTTPRPAST